METTGTGGRVVPFDPSIRTRRTAKPGGATTTRARGRSITTARASRVQAIKEHLLALRHVLESGPESCPRE